MCTICTNMQSVLRPLWTLSGCFKVTRAGFAVVDAPAAPAAEPASIAAALAAEPAAADAPVAPAAEPASAAAALAAEPAAADGRAAPAAEPAAAAAGVIISLRDLLMCPGAPADVVSASIRKGVSQTLHRGVRVQTQRDRHLLGCVNGLELHALSYNTPKAVRTQHDLDGMRADRAGCSADEPAAYAACVHGTCTHPQCGLDATLVWMLPDGFFDVRQGQDTAQLLRTLRAQERTLGRPLDLMPLPNAPTAYYTSTAPCALWKSVVLSRNNATKQACTPSCVMPAASSSVTRHCQCHARCI